ncbi:MAG TPA: HD domain-containing phosphohydrolase, partial [Candidatus Dormibacteraeota bacterium]|nr:HD domain-containing phosphohydrolase [Candidatus Dormibacteraeota bacterium]
GVAEATTARDAAALDRLLTPVVANAAVPRLLLRVLDRQGREVIVVGPDGQVAAQSPSDAFVSEAAVAAVLAGRTDFQGDKYVFLRTDRAGTTLYWAGPIRGLTGQVIGVALVGEPLSAIAASIRSSGGADLTFYGPTGSVLQASLSSTSPLPAATMGLVQPDRPVRFSQSSGGQTYMSLLSDWTMRKMRLGYLAVALNTAQLQAGLDQLRLFLLVLFVVAALITLVIGLALAGAITRPVQRLVGAMGAVAAGDLAQRAPAGPSDEIGYLGKVFNLMTASLQEKTAALEDTYFASIEALARAIDARDPCTYGHSARVAAFSLEIADALGYPQDKREGLRRAALLHDIGKIGIEDHILRKAGALNYAEAKQMREHPVIGHQMLKDVPFLHSSLSGIRHHHERWDGTGYPDTLGGEAIPVQVRILSVADVFDALTSDRPYRDAMSIGDAMELITREAGQQFDPAVVSAFKARAESIVAILRQHRAQEAEVAERAPQPDEIALEKAS